jgi:phage shock protein A
VEPSHIEHQDTLIMFIAEMEVASTSIREAQNALANALLDACYGYQDISAQIDYALTQSEAALEAARDKLEELNRKVIG